MKKKFNTDSLANELKGSLFFSRPKEAKPEVPTPPSQTVQEASRTVLDNPKSPSEQANQLSSSTAPVPPVRDVRPVRRRTRRHAFEIYDDQLERLRKLAMDDRMQGGDGSMSRLLREAIDQFLTEAEGERS